MSRNTSITLGDHFADFIEQQVSAGRYASTSDVVRSGLRLLEEREVKFAALQRALIAGEESETVEGFTFDRFIAERITS